MKVFKNLAQIVTLKGAWDKDGRRLLPADLGIVKKASVVFNEKEIFWVGKSDELPSIYAKLPSRDFSGKTLLPELVDCHTHLVFGGNRASEYSMRLNGADYQEIAKSGGGILSTMKETNQISLAKLESLSRERIARICSYGFGTIEIKSGYGLNIEKEDEISRLIHKLKSDFSPKVQIQNTFMAAHAVPPKFSSSQEYLAQVVFPLMKNLAKEKIIDAVDIFHEDGYFDYSDTEKLFEEASGLGLPVKVHADEFGDNSGALLACRYQALSADHLLKTGIKGITALAKSSTVATLLPGTGFFLGKPQANARKLLDAGAKVAIASDYNPGSCHCDNALLLASLAAPHYGMNLCELWAAITLNAAAALGFSRQGAIVPGLRPRFALFDTPAVDHITYSWGRNFHVA